MKSAAGVKEAAEKVIRLLKGLEGALSQLVVAIESSELESVNK